jgi:hypothetical protein
MKFSDLSGSEQKTMEKISDFLKFLSKSEVTGAELSFLSSPNDILNALQESKDQGTCIGIKCLTLGDGILITAVEEIVSDNGETLIHFKYYDSSGYILPSHKARLSEIDLVYPFSTPFTNPYLASIDKEKPWFF